MEIILPQTGICLNIKSQRENCKMTLCGGWRRVEAALTKDELIFGGRGSVGEPPSFSFKQNRACFFMEPFIPGCALKNKGTKC